MVHDGEQHAGATAAAGLCWHGRCTVGEGRQVVIWALLPTPGRQGGEGTLTNEELVVHGVQRPALHLGPLAADQREQVRRAQLTITKGSLRPGEAQL